MVFLTVADTTTSTLFRDRIDGCDTQHTKFISAYWRPVVETIENVVPRSKGYFFFNVEKRAQILFTVSSLTKYQKADGVVLCTLQIKRSVYS